MYVYSIEYAYERSSKKHFVSLKQKILFKNIIFSRTILIFLTVFTAFVNYEFYDCQNINNVSRQLWQTHMKYIQQTCWILLDYSKTLLNIILAVKALNTFVLPTKRKQHNFMSTLRVKFMHNNNAQQVCWIYLYVPIIVVLHILKEFRLVVILFLSYSQVLVQWWNYKIIYRGGIDVKYPSATK